MSASDQRLIDLLFAHRAADDLFNCACGWHGDGFGDLHRLHQLDALLSSPDLIDVLQARGRLEQAGQRWALTAEANGGVSDQWHYGPTPSRALDKHVDWFVVEPLFRARVSKED